MEVHIAVLAFDGAQMLDVAGPMEVFSQAVRHTPDGMPYRLWYLGAGESVTLSSGLMLRTVPYRDAPEHIDTLIIPGGTEAGLRTLLGDAACVGWISAQAQRVRRLASVCTGTFVLAGAGLLDGRRATTHWASCDRLEAFRPRIRVQRDVIFTEDAGVYTSAGVSTGIDLALHLVEQDLGRALAFRVARHLVLFLRRSGLQDQQSAPLAAQATASTRIADVVEYILSHPGADLGLAALAQRAALSERHFARRFHAETGETVARFVRAARLDAARMLLRESGLRVKQIADRCGFRSADVLGRRFREAYGVTPERYRCEFRSSGRETIPRRTQSSS